MRRPRVLVISFTDLASDPRVDRQITALSSRYDVVAAGLTPPAHNDVEFVELDDPPLGLVDGGVGVARLVARRFDSAYWRHPRTRESLRRLSAIQTDLVVANELAALGIGLQLEAPLVFDAHEYAPEEFADRLWWRTLIGPYADWQCRRYLPRVAAMMTVSSGIAAAYQHAYRASPAVVVNAPAFTDLTPTPVRAPIRILHHGIAVPGRGLDEMLSLADLLDDRFTIDFVLAGRPSRFRDEFVARAARNIKVNLPKPVPTRDIARMANGYDIGLYLLPATNFNQRHALPNKFFEFIQGRLALAIGPSPEMAKIVRQYGCGVVAEEFTVEALAAKINALDSAQIAAFKQAAHSAAAELTAERESATILSLTESALRNGS